MRRALLSSMVVAGLAVQAGAFPLSVSLSRRQMDPRGGEALAIHVKAPSPSVEARVLDPNDHQVAALRPVSPELFMWDGKDGAGRSVPPGHYIVEIVNEPYLWSAAVDVR